MLYAVIKRFDSLREITTSLLADTNKLAHIGITFKIGIFEAIYRDLYARYKGELISDSRTSLAGKGESRNGMNKYARERVMDKHLYC